MFVLSTPEQSDAIHQELIDIETGMFSELGLHFKVGKEMCRWAGKLLRALPALEDCVIISGQSCSGKA